MKILLQDEASFTTENGTRSRYTTCELSGNTHYIDITIEVMMEKNGEYVQIGTVSLPVEELRAALDAFAVLDDETTCD